MWSATANIPSWFGMLVYSEVTSKVGKMVSSPQVLDQIGLFFDEILCISYVGFCLGNILFDMFIHKFTDICSWVVNRTAYGSAWYSLFGVF